ncbi:hypothetical protein IPJ70_02105 [Candidatus Campbellbacteria bacterium]|nr:MAG: hypothetical protein IPJ70_02105 [Candidatus Campbellbacteria bacterium]
MEENTTNTQVSGSSSKGGKKGLIIGIGIVVLLVGGFMFSRGRSPLGGPLGGLDGISSLSDLMSRGTPAKCQYSMASEGFEQTSTVYYDGKKMYMENASMMGGKKVQSNMLIDGEFQYMWSDDGTRQGLKMAVVKDAPAPSENIPTGQASQVDFGKNLQMKCDRWSGDDGVFTPPSDVTFVDLSDLGKSFGAPSSMCGSCSALTGEDKIQCEATFCQQ